MSTPWVVVSGEFQVLGHYREAGEAARAVRHAGPGAHSVRHGEIHIIHHKTTRQVEIAIRSRAREGWYRSFAPTLPPAPPKAPASREADEDKDDVLPPVPPRDVIRTCKHCEKTFQLGANWREILAARTEAWCGACRSKALSGAAVGRPSPAWARDEGVPGARGKRTRVPVIDRGLRVCTRKGCKTVFQLEGHETESMRLLCPPCRVVAAKEALVSRAMPLPPRPPPDVQVIPIAAPPPTVPEESPPMPASPASPKSLPPCACTSTRGCENLARPAETAVVPGRERWCTACQKRIDSYMRMMGHAPPYAPDYPMGNTRMSPSALKMHAVRAAKRAEAESAAPASRVPPEAPRVPPKTNGASVHVVQKTEDILPAFVQDSPGGAACLAPSSTPTTPAHVPEVPTPMSTLPTPPTSSAPHAPRAPSPASSLERLSALETTTLARALHAVLLVETIGWDTCELLASRMQKG